MSFDSIPFIILFLSFFILYWGVLGGKTKAQNILIIITGYIFYGWWDWRFLFLLAFSTTVDFCVGWYLGKISDDRKRKILFITGCCISLGVLAFFKYYNFFIGSFITALGNIGIHADVTMLHIILPVGISFYTFQSLSYTIDIYRRKITPCNSYIDFLAFASFFPQLVAGPIERAEHLLPQMQNKRVFIYENGITGIRLITIGLFKKLVVADNCGLIVNTIFPNYNNVSAVGLIIGAVLFAFQIYGDFSGYSDIARGLGKLLGFDIIVNFRTPYFAKNIRDFWRRWHISLTSWFRDYIYFGLGGSKQGKWKMLRNTFIVFLISGLWHGANWTFVIWGVIHFLFFIPSILVGKKDKLTTEHSIPHYLSGILSSFFTFVLVCIAWVFFRSPDIHTAFMYLRDIVIKHDTSFSFLITNTYWLAFLIALFSIAQLIIIDYYEYKMKLLPAIAYFILVLNIVFLGNYRNPLQFIYFQF